MESSWLGLYPDGSGWSAWASAAGGMSVGRFTWNCPAATTLELRYSVLLSGSWTSDLPGQMQLGTLDDQLDDDTVVRTGYSIRLDTSIMMTGPFTALHLDSDIEMCRMYALVRHEIEAKDDPAFATVPPS